MVLASLLIMAAVLLPSMVRSTTSRSIQCVNNLKQIGLATRVWAGDHDEKYPPQVSGTNGGSMDFITGPNVWRHFLVMSNELSNTRVLICPADEGRFRATNFVWMRNSNISFFFGIDATEANLDMILSGDRNITNGAPLKNGLLELLPKRSTGWTAEMHHEFGNITFTDGHVAEMNSGGLQAAVVFTNRLQMPILSP
jgi:prepilin-type processing-associated H-X9-DG protein